MEDEEKVKDEKGTRGTEKEKKKRRQTEKHHDVKSEQFVSGIKAKKMSETGRGRDKTHSFHFFHFFLIGSPRFEIF